MFRKGAVKREQCSERQRQFDRALAAAMFNTAKRPARKAAEESLAVREADLAVAEKPIAVAEKSRRSGSADHVELFSIDLLAHWLKP